MICPVCKHKDIRELKNTGLGFLEVIHLDGIECRCTSEEWISFNTVGYFDIRAWKKKLLEMIDDMRKKIEELPE